MFWTLPISCQTVPLYLNVNISVLLAVAVTVGAVLAANSKTVFQAIETKYKLTAVQEKELNGQSKDIKEA